MKNVGKFIIYKLKVESKLVAACIKRDIGVL